MSEWNGDFILSFDYKGRRYDLAGRLVQAGYMHQLHVLLNEDTLILEFDEERNYRVIADANTMRSIDQGLLQALVEKASSLHL